MDEVEILKILPKLYFVKGEKTKYALLLELKLGTSGTSFKKIAEFISMGFLDKIGSNPPTFVVNKKCRKRMRDFFENTPIGENIVMMIEDDRVVLR